MGYRIHLPSMEKMVKHRRSGSGRLVMVAVALLGFATACPFREPRVPSEQLRAVPEVVGDRVEVAREQLESEGFLVRIIPEGAMPPPGEIVEEPEGKCADGRVIEQDPTADVEALRAATVVLTARGC